MFYVKIIEKVCSVVNVLAMLCLAAMACLTTADVVMRYFFTKPITGATEYVQVFWVISALTIGVTAMADEHTKVDFIINKFPRMARKLLNAITVGIGSVFCFIMAYSTMENAMYSKSYHIVYWQSKFPEWISMALFAVSFFVLGLACIAVVIKEWAADRGENGALPSEEGKENKHES